MYWFNSALLGWIDKNGRTCTSQTPTINQTAAPTGVIVALAEAAQELSSCKLRAVQFVTTLVIAGPASDGDYPTINDRATFMCRTANTAPQLIIPGPKAAILKPNRVDVNMSNPFVSAYCTAVMAALGSASGSPITRVQYGRRSIWNVGTPF